MRISDWSSAVCSSDLAGILVGHRRHLAQLGSGDAQDILLLLALGLGNDDDGAVAARAGDQGEADAGVAGGALDDDAAGPQRATLLGILDDRRSEERR